MTQLLVSSDYIKKALPCFKKKNQDLENWNFKSKHTGFGKLLKVLIPRQEFLLENKKILNVDLPSKKDSREDKGDQRGWNRCQPYVCYYKNIIKGTEHWDIGCLKAWESQAGQDLRRSLVHPPTQSRASSGLRPGCPGLRLVTGLQTLHGQRWHSFPGRPAPLPHPPWEHIGRSFFWTCYNL